MMPKSLSKLGMKTAYSYIEKDSEKNLPKLLAWVDRLACVAGSSKGKSYIVRGGINSIGPGEGWNIVYLNDEKVFTPCP